ncbi:hypothetical protein Q3304_08890 [Clostridioides sp. GD02377]|uniref:hypothetical protein n=1 Tax=unclassified Clostridioides TaxID=2635829 RepID=UPI00389DBDDE
MKNNKINKVAMKYLTYKGNIVGYRIRVNSKTYDVAKADWNKHKEKEYKDISESNSIEMEISNNLLMSKEEINSGVSYKQEKEEDNVGKLVFIYERCIKTNIWTDEELVLMAMYSSKSSIKELQDMGINHTEQEILTKIDEINSKKNKNIEKGFEKNEKLVFL